MQNLNDKEWREYKVKNIFTIEKCKCSNVSLLKPGDFPYIGATNRNNGLMRFVEKKEQWITKGNCIVFICDGQGSVGYSIYKSEDFIGSTTLKAGRNPFLNKYTAQFFISALDKNRSIYSYGYKRTENRLLNETFFLPADAQGNPDYAFMEVYVKEQIKGKIQKYIAYIQEQIATMEYRVIPDLQRKKWATFYIDDIFTIHSGKRFVSESMHPGTRPFIGATDSGNGITNYVSDTNSSLDQNVLGVNYDGNGMVISFYHPYECIFSDSVKRFHLKQHKDNKFILLFMKTVILQQKSKYHYGYKFNSNRMARQIIALPVNEQGEPDYNYMEQYSKNLILQKYQQYLAYKGV